MVAEPIELEPEFRPRGRGVTTGQAQVYGWALYQLSGGNVQALTPAEVVEAAEPEDSLLHSWFEWNDGLAGSEWRLMQARALLRSIKVKVKIQDEVKWTRAYVSVKTEKGPAYKATEIAIAEDAPQLLERAKQDLREWRKKWHAFMAMTSFKEELQAIYDELQEL